MACIVGPSTSTNPRSSITLRNAATIRRAAEERLQRLGVAEQVDVPLAAARLDVGQAVPLLGRREQALAQEREVRRRRRSARRSWCSPSVPSTPTRSPRSSSSASAQACSPTCFLPMKTWIRLGPVADVEEDGPSPVPRRSMIRPAIRTAGAPGVSALARPRDVQRRGPRRSPGGRRTAGPRGRSPARRSAAASRPDRFQALPRLFGHLNALTLHFFQLRET